VNLQWAAPTYKKKNGSARFISDFRELNKRISRKPYPPEDPRNATEPRRVRATSIDLNMGYYHIELIGPGTLNMGQGSRIPKLPMGLCNSPDVFKRR
jgi:hypothetical protein